MTTELITSAEQRLATLSTLLGARVGGTMTLDELRAFLLVAKSANDDDGAFTQADMASLFNWSSYYTHRIAQRLVKLELLALRRSVHDRRSKDLVLGDYGATLLKRLKQQLKKEAA